MVNEKDVEARKNLGIGLAFSFLGVVFLFLYFVAFESSPLLKYISLFSGVVFLGIAGYLHLKYRNGKGNVKS